MNSNKIISINPSTKEVLGEVEISTHDEIIQKVSVARKAQKMWKDIGLSKRIEILRNAVESLKKHQEEFSNLASKEMGMPISQSTHDAHGIIEYLEWNLDNAEKYLSSEVVYEDDDMKHQVLYEPTGVVVAIAPWNFPSSNFAWMVFQNLIVGNVVIFKDSEEVVLCGKLIEKIMNEANLPEGVFSEVYGKGETADFLIHQDIDMICFTGSTAVGQHIYKVAAEKFIKVCLELGGSAPGIVLEDADVSKVIDTIYANRFDNCGQICDGLKRLIVHESKYDLVIQTLKEKLSSIHIGDASDKSTDIGPLVSEKQIQSLDAQVKDAIEKGAVIEYKSELSNKLSGFYYPSTLLSKITKDMRVWNEEVFGPVLPIIKFKTIDEAIALANDTKYGLGGYVFTEDKNKFEEVAKQIESGMIQQNNTSYVQFSSPFGGCKKSGIGRIHGKFGFHELSRVKLISTEK